MKSFFSKDPSNKEVVITIIIVAIKANLFGRNIIPNMHRIINVEEIFDINSFILFFLSKIKIVHPKAISQNRMGIK